MHETSIALKSRLGLLLLAFTVLLVSTGGTAFAASKARPEVMIKHARIRLLPGDLPLAGYFDLTNTGQRKLVLTGASSKAFDDVMLHRTEIVNGQAKMVMLDQMTIEPGHSVHFAPKGYHLMLMGRNHPLSRGESVPIRLEFAGGKSIEVKFIVMGADLK
jgi:copper(I)-binding protein